MFTLWLEKMRKTGYFLGSLPFVLACKPGRNWAHFRGVVCSHSGWEEHSRWMKWPMTEAQYEAGSVCGGHPFVWGGWAEHLWHHILYEGGLLLAERQWGAVEPQNPLWTAPWTSGMVATMIPGKEIRVPNHGKLGNILDWHFSFLFHYKGL